jgi:hypothetical protein
MSKLYRLSVILAVLMFLVVAPMALAQTGGTGGTDTNQGTQPGDTGTEGDTTEGDNAGTDTTQMTQTSAATDSNTAAGDNGTTAGTDVDAQGTDATVGDQTDTGKLGQDPQAQSGQQNQADQDVLLPETGGSPSSWPSLLLLTAGAVFVVTGLLSLSFARRSR